MPRSRQHWIVAVMVATALPVALISSDEVEKPLRSDPAAWGDDHVGKSLPSYVTGEECLFCHRTIGPAWPDNAHQLTIRPANRDDPALSLLRKLGMGDDVADETQYLMGSQRITRFLKRSKEYGQLDILSASFVSVEDDCDDAGEASGRRTIGRWKDADALHWNKQTFGERCAGCHTTAVNIRTQSFSALSLDCFTCHGDVVLDHNEDVSRVLLSASSREPRQVVSICGQCHLRGGKSRSSKLPYPNTFVAGDNLFRDFQVDFSDEAIDALPAVDRHVYLSAREVAVFGRSEVTCLTCHDVHGQNSDKHQELENIAICSACHIPETDNSKLRDAMLPFNRRRVHSRVCDY